MRVCSCWAATLLVASAIVACGGGETATDPGAGGDDDDATVSEATPPDIIDVSYPFDVSPEAIASGVPITQVVFIPTDKPPGAQPDLSPFYPKSDPKKYCLGEQDKPPTDGSNPSCTVLANTFKCQFIQNPREVGAWLKPAKAFLYCMTCEPGPSGGPACSCTRPAIDKVATVGGGTWCVDAIVHDGAKPVLVTSLADFLALFAPVDDAAEATAFATFSHGVRHAFTQSEFVGLRPPGDPEAGPFRCLTDRMIGTVATAGESGAFDVETFLVPDAAACPDHSLQHVTLSVDASGVVTTKGSALLCADDPALCE